MYIKTDLTETISVKSSDLVVFYYDCQSVYAYTVWLLNLQPCNCSTQQVIVRSYIAKLAIFGTK